MTYPNTMAEYHKATEKYLISKISDVRRLLQHWNNTLEINDKELKEHAQKVLKKKTERYLSQIYA